MKDLTVGTMLLLTMTSIVYGYIYSDCTGITNTPNSRQYALTIGKCDSAQPETSPVKVGGHLLIVDSLEGQDWPAIVASVDLYQDWLNGTYTEPDGRRKGVRARPLTYAAWLSVAPDNGCGYGDYTWLERDISNDYYWDLRAIIEVP